MIVKRSVAIKGHRTSISIEELFWNCLKGIAARRELSLAALIAEIDRARGKEENLSSALRVFVLSDALSRLPAPASEAETSPVQPALRAVSGKG
ncbi:ribbon-helix-helix domain-containing protein [Aureimonas fodinaquatilis]|uniref:Ribbon-helix-helix domain-containing protein n=1 Tax=Aureimonas fodinaquatilis TaxID=2565783 RepID=A0A5B0E199_9HYPH|nr:ribbon-helix-helix domain-containing protein [Aureimonas fodinaquatilis]KAA0972603.1 ribbon-helix-helix domain-containing protein [Aureimonas fodinaquatilis]